MGTVNFVAQTRRVPKGERNIFEPIHGALPIRNGSFIELPAPSLRSLKS